MLDIKAIRQNPEILTKALEKRHSKIDLTEFLALDKKTPDAFELLFSESNTRFVATVPPEKCAEFERLFAGTACACVGEVVENAALRFTGKGAGFEAALGEMLDRYKATLDHI